MKYIIKLSTKKVVYEIYTADNDYILKSFEQEVNQETFDTMPIPSKFVNGEWVEVTVDEYPTTDEMPDWVEPPPYVEPPYEPTTAEILTAMLKGE